MYPKNSKTPRIYTPAAFACGERWEQRPGKQFVFFRKRITIMPEYEQSLSVQAAPERVFEFVSSLDNLPRYLPTVHQAEPQAGERVRVKGEAGGHPYDSDGYFRVDNSAHRMEWGSDGENNYSGWLKVGGEGETSEVTVHLSFQPKPEQAERFAEQTGSRDKTIQEGIEASLLSIRNEVEGRGGKVEPTAANG